MTLLLICGTMVHAQKENSLIRQGNRNFEKGDFREAEKDYRKALEVNKLNPKAQFNLGTAVYSNNNYEEATRIYGSMAEQKGEAKNQARVLHNLGNSLLQAKEYEKSIAAYKNSLMKDPGSRDTKYNLEYARMMLKKQQEQQQQQKNEDQNDDKKDQQDQKNQDQQQQNQENRNQQPDQKKISKEDAERMLEALKNDEKKTQQKVKKQQAKVQVVGVEKDW